MAAETPCSVLYNDIRSFGGLKHLEIARMLINGNSYLGSTLLEKCSSNRSYLTRYIVHRKPDQCAPSIYSDFTVTTLNLSSAICSKLGGGESAYRAIAEHYRGPAANEMMSALASYKLDSRLYANALNRIDIFDGNAVREKSTLFLMLFVATGALADPVQGVATVERFCDSKTGGHFGTTETTVGRGFMSSLEQPRTVAPNLGLLRTHADNCADMQIHPLTRDPRGTVIGSLPKTSPSITDVGADASREHLRIWLEGEHWYAQGLGSTNGTVLESGAGDGDIVIEPPRDQREPGKIYPPVEIENSDRLHLGLYTTFAKDYHYLAEIYNGEGKEYQLFRELKVSPYSTNETMVRQWKGKDTCWWERTVSPDSSETEGTLYINRVGHDGDVFTYATPAEKPNKLTCVIPGFCI